MLRKLFLVLLYAVVVPCHALVDFEKPSPAYILGTKQIRIPEYPDAFNPSIIRWEGKLLLSFRNIAVPKDCYNTSEIGLVWLDDEFNPVGSPQILNFSDCSLPYPRRAEDARLIEVDGGLFMIYSDNEDLIITKARYRVYVAKLKIKDGRFDLESKERLDLFEGHDRGFREKNWTPFDYCGTLLLSYSLAPHLVFRPLTGTGACETVAVSEQPIDWKWGELRGGTQTLWVDGCYLTFFHSSERMVSMHSSGMDIPHYFMGACAFEGAPPFSMTYISPEPIIGADFFTGTVYKPYFGSWRGTFPGGFVFDDDYIYVAYGKQNHELWMVKLDKKGCSKALCLWTNNFFAIVFCFASISITCEAIDLEQRYESFVLETKKIDIPGHPYAFNPSIVSWRGSLLLSFRELPVSQDSFPCDINSSSLSQIGLVFLNNDFTPDGEPCMLDIPGFHIEGSTYVRAEDARLINVDEHLYITYSDNLNEIVTEGGFRMYVGELDFDGEQFFLRSLESMRTFPGESSRRREKNWVPLDYQGTLLLAYSIQPHRIFFPYLDGTEECGELSTSTSDLFWRWGELRGGTPALRCGSEYLAFFHSSIEIGTDHSFGVKMPHYFIGAYTFRKEPPFDLTRISPYPIVGKGFYQGPIYTYYWKPVRVVFPGGYIFDDDYIYLAYGRQDHEMWIAKIDKALLFDSLIPVTKP